MTDPVRWRNIISIQGDDLFNVSSAEFRTYKKRLEDFLSFVEGTEMGQKEIFRGIREKYGAAPLKINLNSGSRSDHSSDGATIGLNVMDEEYIAFFDQLTGKPVPYSFERLAFHELVHASDPEIKLGTEYSPGSCFLAQREEFANSRTNLFVRAHKPEMGVLDSYKNTEGKIPEIIYEFTPNPEDPGTRREISKGVTGMDILRADDGTLRKEFEENAKTIQENRPDECAFNFWTRKPLETEQSPPGKNPAARPPL